MAAFEYAAGDYKLACETKENGIIVTGIRGNGSNLTIPEEIIYQDKEYPVLEIGKKAALGCRTVREIFVPDTVVATGDWAFAQCPQLTNIRIPQGVSLGVGVFEDCPSLLQICVEAAKEDFSLEMEIALEESEEINGATETNVPNFGTQETAEEHSYMFDGNQV